MIPTVQPSLCSDTKLLLDGEGCIPTIFDFVCASNDRPTPTSTRRVSKIGEHVLVCLWRPSDQCFSVRAAGIQMTRAFATTLTSSAWTPFSRYWLYKHGVQQQYIRLLIREYYTWYAQQYKETHTRLYIYTYRRQLHSIQPRIINNSTRIRRVAVSTDCVTRENITSPVHARTILRCVVWYNIFDTNFFSSSYRFSRSTVDINVVERR